MKKVYLLICTYLIISCNENQNVKSTSSINTLNENKSMQQSDSSKWMNNFRDFRNVVYQKDKNKVKKFIDFPIMNENNEIWALIYENDDKEFIKYSDKVKPFTEQDFDKYFDKLFSKRFINTILKIKSEELFVKGETETKDFKEDSSSYKMNATFDKKEKKLELVLFSKTQYNEDDDDGEFSIDYQFDFLEDGQIKFRQVRIAG